MVSVIVHLLLIAGLVLCPFRCQSRLSPCDGCAAEAERKHGCCTACRHAQPDEPAPTPADPQHEHDGPAGEPCQCICGGAVVERPASDGLIDTAHVAALVDAHAPDIAPVVGRALGAWHPPPVVAGLNTGRALCTLHRSFRC